MRRQRRRVVPLTIARGDVRPQNQIVLVLAGANRSGQVAALKARFECEVIELAARGQDRGGWFFCVIINSMHRDKLRRHIKGLVDAHAFDGRRRCSWPLDARLQFPLFAPVPRRRIKHVAPTRHTRKRGASLIIACRPWGPFRAMRVRMLAPVRGPERALRLGIRGHRVNCLPQRSGCRRSRHTRILTKRPSLASTSW